MKFRSYLRLLQPIPALLMSGLFANGAAGFGTLFFGLPQRESYQLALLVALPLLLGCDLAAAAHVALHRPFALLLPDLRRKLLRPTLAALLVCIVAIAAAVAWFFPAVPVPAVLGLAAVLLALPTLDRHRLVARPGPLNLFLNLGGLQFRLLGIAGWILFMQFGARQLVPAMAAAPWLFFAAGLAAASWLLDRAFSRAEVRERASIPFFSPNIAWFALFSPGVQTRHRDESRRHLLQQGADTGQRELAVKPGRDWPVRAVGSDTRDWLRVFWHATYGAMSHGSFLHAQRLYFFVLLGYGLVMPGLGFLFATFDHHRFGLADYFASLTALNHPGFDSVSSASQAGMSLVGLMLILGFTFVLTLAGQLGPQLAYPVSRARLARVSFVNALLQLACALVLPTAALTVVSVLGQALSGAFLPWLGVLPLLRLDLALLPLLLLAAVTGRLRRLVTRLAALTLLATAACALAVGLAWWSELLLRPGSLLALGLLVTGGIWLLHWQILRHFRSCDLVAEAAQARPFAFGVSFSLARNSAPAR